MKVRFTILRFLFVKVNSILNLVPATTKCLYAGSDSDCITCPAASKFLDPVSRNCFTVCPFYYFGNSKINQCRSCDPTCYTCSDRFVNNCISCTGVRYFNPLANTCILNCEAAGMTKSILTPNLCIAFEAKAVLVNVDEITPIDPNSFTYLTANVTYASSTGYTLLWYFNNTENKILNNNSTKLIMPLAGPFVGATNSLTVNLNPAFFMQGFNYKFNLNITKTNGGISVNVTQSWILIMNSAPKNGNITVVPTIGLRNTTTFIINCVNWTDDNTNSTDFMYRYYSIENNTATLNLITNWTSSIQTSTNFTVRYYQIPSTTLTLYCDVKDKMGSTNTSSTNVNYILNFR